MKQCIGSFARVVRAIAISALVSLNTQCSLTVDATREQCKTTEDCQKRGDDFSGSVCKDSACVPDPAWACLRQDDAASAEPKTGPFTVRLPVVSVLSQAPMPDVTARMYRKIDVDLASPIGDPVVSDSNGIIELRADSGFDGFISLSHTAIGEALYFVNPPIRGDETVAPVRLASPTMVGALLAQVGRSYDASRGITVLTAEDCTAKAAEGISYSSSAADAQTQSFYSVDGLPTTKTTATDASGYGGLIGLLPGTTAIRGSSEKLGEIGRLSLFVKAGVVSYSRMVPSVQK